MDIRYEFAGDHINIQARCQRILSGRELMEWIGIPLHRKAGSPGSLASVLFCSDTLGHILSQRSQDTWLPGAMYIQQGQQCLLFFSSSAPFGLHSSFAVSFHASRSQVNWTVYKWDLLVVPGTFSLRKVSFQNVLSFKCVLETPQF